MEFYFKLKTIFEFVIPGVLFGIFILFAIIAFLHAVKSDWKANKNAKILKEAGFKRDLHSVPSVGDGATYWYVRDSDEGTWEDNHIFERDLYRLSARELKKKYKSLQKK